MPAAAATSSGASVQRVRPHMAPGRRPSGRSDVTLAALCAAALSGRGARAARTAKATTAGGYTQQPLIVETGLANLFRVSFSLYAGLLASTVISE